MSRRRAVLITVGVVVVVLFGAGAVVLFAVKLPALSAAGALTQYASAIESGDLALAGQLAQAPHGSPQPVGGAVLADPANRISATSTRIDSSSGSSATGTVAFDLDGKHHSATLKLVRGPAQLGILPNWRVTTPLTTTISVEVPAAGIASLNGVDAPLDEHLKLTVYPGRYAVGLAASSAWYASSTVSVDAGTAAVTATPTATPTASLGAEVLKQLKTTIDACVAMPVPVPTGCPFSDAQPGTMAGFSWKLDDYPTVSFLDPTHFFLTGGQVTADYVYTHSYIVNKHEEDPIAVSGTGSVSFHGTRVKVALGS